MVKHEWQVGEVTIVVFAPEGVDVQRATATVRSVDRMEFLRAVEAVGGLEALTLPVRKEPYAQQAIAYPRREDGAVNGSAYVALEEPLDVQAERKAPPVAPHPFFAPLAERRERDRSPTASTEETRRGPGPVAAGEEFPTVGS